MRWDWGETARESWESELLLSENHGYILEVCVENKRSLSINPSQQSEISRGTANSFLSDAEASQELMDDVLKQSKNRRSLLTHRSKWPDMGGGWGWWRCCLIRLANKWEWEEFLASGGREQEGGGRQHLQHIFLASFFRGCHSDAESQPRVDVEATRRKPSRAHTDTWGRYGDVGVWTVQASARSSPRRSDL